MFEGYVSSGVSMYFEEGYNPGPQRFGESNEDYWKRQESERKKRDEWKQAEDRQKAKEDKEWLDKWKRENAVTPMPQTPYMGNKFEAKKGEGLTAWVDSNGALHVNRTDKNGNLVLDKKTGQPVEVFGEERVECWNNIVNDINKGGTKATFKDKNGNPTAGSISVKTKDGWTSIFAGWELSADGKSNSYKVEGKFGLSDKDATYNQNDWQSVKIVNGKKVTEDTTVYIGDAIVNILLDQDDPYNSKSWFNTFTQTWVDSKNVLFAQAFRPQSQNGDFITWVPYGFKRYFGCPGWQDWEQWKP